MRDYTNSKIYKIVADDYFYIGSTTDTLTKRLIVHRSTSKVKINRNVYKKLNEIGWENVRIILIEECKDIENKDQLLRKEDEYIMKYKNDEHCLNHLRAFLTDEDKKEARKINNTKYTESHKEGISINKKVYHISHKEEISINRKERMICPHCNKDINKLNRSRHFKSDICKASYDSD